MRLLLSWAREFVDVTAPAGDVADTLALRGFEVASIEPLDGGDAVIDFEVTANRPDCLSVLGLAREIATAYNLPLRAETVDSGGPLPSSSTSDDSGGLTVSLDAADLCPRYAAVAAEITPASSPAWMTSRLQAAGIRPISPIVDVTNYVLIERGHPMHAFDLEALENRAIHIRRARPGEAMTTLDGVARALDAEMLVIADASRAQAIAGVMGGAASEVSGRTRFVAFESACFKPASIRRTSKKLGLKTEASARFERGADVNAPVAALRRAIALMQQIGAGRIVGPIVDRYPTPVAPRVIGLRRQRLAMVLGMRVPDAEVERILESLGLTVAVQPSGWTVTAPTFRVDLISEIDLIEEVGRHYGFDKLEASFPVLTSPAPTSSPRIARDALVRQVLTAGGFSEAITFGFIETKAAAAFGASAGAGPGAEANDLAMVRIANPLSAKFDVLRHSLFPGLVDAVAHNRRHGLRDIALFEIGSRYRRLTGESLGAGIAWTGSALPEHWSGHGRDVDFFDVKGVVEQLCGALGLTPRFAPATEPFLVAGQSAHVLHDGVQIGRLGLVTPAVAEGRGAPRQDKIFVAELDLDRVVPAHSESEARVSPLPRFPSVVRDVSIVVADTLPAEIIRGTIQAAGGSGSAPLVDIGFFDRYKGKGVADDAVSVSVRLTFQAPDRTLTDGEIQQSVDGIVGALKHEHGAIQR